MASGISKRLAGGALALMLAGCAAAAATPAFPQPDASAAGEAYLRSLRGDYLEGREVETPERMPGYMRDTYRRMHDPAADMDIVQRQIGGFQRLNLSGCRWAAVEERRIPMTSRARAGGQFEAGWLCEVEVFLNTLARDQVSARGEGYFFMNGDSLEFAGEYAHGWETAGGTNTGGRWSERQATAERGSGWKANEGW